MIGPLPPQSCVEHERGARRCRRCYTARGNGQYGGTHLYPCSRGPGGGKVRGEWEGERMQVLTAGIVSCCRRVGICAGSASSGMLRTGGMWLHA
eukprot:5459042-Pyramimonas_sp.AAC.1